MINNNPYNIPQKKPLSQSKILSDMSTSRHSATHLQNKPSSDSMYKSNIFMKNSSIMNLQSEPTFLQLIREPLSPNSKYTKQLQSVHFLPPYTSNGVQMRQSQVNYFPINLPKDKDINIDRILNEFKQKIEGLEKRLQSQDRKNISVNETSNKGKQYSNEIKSTIVKIQDSIINSGRLKQVIGGIFTEYIESHTKPIWQKVNDLNENINYSNTGVSSQKLIRLEESFLRSQSQKLHEEQLMSRIKTIQKTIRQMGQDIHLVNDKQERLSAKIENQLPWLRNQINGMKILQKKCAQSEKKYSQFKQEMENLMKKVKSIQSSLQSNIMSKLTQFQNKMNLDKKQPNVSCSFDKYPSQPIILKYLEKFQIMKSSLNKNIQTSKQKELIQEITVSQMTYYIDQDGFILDKDCFYLIDSTKGDKIKLSSNHLQLLKQKNILI